MKLLVATNNAKKLKEMERILSALGIVPVSLKEAGIEVEVEETGTTFEENAMLKARAVYEIAKMPVVADDSGISVDALGGAPGIYSARYSGIEHDDEANNDKLLLEMAGKENRRAVFVCAVACILNDETSFVLRGECIGEVAHKRQGPPGFGYDPIFLVGGKSYSELTAEGKDKIGHRGNALRALAEELKKYL